MIGELERRLRILETRLRPPATPRLDWLEERARELNRPRFGDGPPPCPGLAWVDVRDPCGNPIEGATVTVTVGATTVATGDTDATGTFAFDPTGYVGDTAVITVSGYSGPSGCSPTHIPLSKILACNTYLGRITFTAPGYRCCSACSGGYFCAPSLCYTLTNALSVPVIDPYYGTCSMQWQDAGGAITGGEGFEWRCSGADVLARRQFGCPKIRCAPVWSDLTGCSALINYPWVCLGAVVDGTLLVPPFGSGLAWSPLKPADSFTCDPFSAVWTYEVYARYLNPFTGATVDCGPITQTLTIYEC